MFMEIHPFSNRQVLIRGALKQGAEGAPPGRINTEMEERCLEME